MGFDASQRREFFEKLAYHLKHPLYPASAPAELFEGTIELVYRVSVPFDWDMFNDGSDMSVSKLNAISNAIASATPTVQALNTLRYSLLQMHPKRYPTLRNWRS
jgi:hypothetical protein